MALVYIDRLDVLTDGISFDELWIRINNEGWVRDIAALNEGVFVGRVETFGYTLEVDQRS